MSVDSIEQKLSAVVQPAAMCSMGNAVQDILLQNEVEFFHQGPVYSFGRAYQVNDLLLNYYGQAFLRTFGGGLCQWKSFGIRGQLMPWRIRFVEELAMEVPGVGSNPESFMRAKAGFLCAQHCEHERDQYAALRASGTSDRFAEYCIGQPLRVGKT